MITPLDNYQDLMKTIDRVETVPAQVLSDRLWNLLHPNRVIDWGCANGEYLLPFLMHQCQIQGVDAEPTAGSKIPDNFYCADLRQPIQCGGRFDLAICLEVGEHLQPEFADQLVENVANSADVILWSAATPGQGGYMHHNEQPKEYWLAKFFALGYVLHPLNDLVRSEIKDNPLFTTTDWLINNTYLFTNHVFKSKHDWGIESYGQHWLQFINWVGEPVTVIEIGAFQGRSSYWMMQALLTHPQARLIVVDPFQNNPNMFDGADMGDYHAEFMGNLAPYLDKITIIREFSDKAEKYLAALVKPKSVPLGYIDGSHEYVDSIHDARMLAPYIKVGGLMVFDDTGPGGNWAGPAQAVKDFLAKNHSFELVYAETQSMVRRVK